MALLQIVSNACGDQLTGVELYLLKDPQWVEDVSHLDVAIV